MDEVMDVGKTILPDGQPLSLVTCAGVESWLENGTKHSYGAQVIRHILCSLQKEYSM